MWSHFSTTTVNKQISQSVATTPTTLNRPASPKPFDQRRPLPPQRNDGFVWMTVPKNYRCVGLTAYPRNSDSYVIMALNRTRSDCLALLKEFTR